MGGCLLYTVVFPITNQETYPAFSNWPRDMLRVKVGVQLRITMDLLIDVLSEPRSGADTMDPNLVTYSQHMPLNHAHSY